MARAHRASDAASITQLASKVRVHQILTSGELKRKLDTLEEELAELGEGAGLVVVDSMAAPVRREFGTRTGREAAERAAILGGLTARLK